jgi:hypothetical protein
MEMEVKTMELSRKKIMFVVLPLALTAIIGTSLVFACGFWGIGRIKMPWQVVPAPSTAVMTPSEISVSIGKIIEGQTVSSPSKDSGASLNVTAVTNITVTLGGYYEGLTALNVTINLVNATKGATVYTATVTNTAPSATISNVAVGTYQIYIAFTATAGYTPSCGAAVITLSPAPPPVTIPPFEPTPT